jgi:hypothetical protein
MLHKLFGHMRQNVVAYLALFVALGGTTAYAANEWTGTNIVDSSLTGQDIFPNSVPGGDITNGSLTGADIFDNTIGGADITNESIGAADIGSQQVGPDEVLNDSLLQSDIRAGAVTGDEVLDNSLTGTDINESTLNLPKVPTTTTFASGSETFIPDTLTQIASKSLSAGSYSLTATVHGVADVFFQGDHTVTLYCEARSGSNFIGAAEDRSVLIDGGRIDRTIPIVAGVQVPAGGGSVSVWCRSQGDSLVEAQMMITRIDGFF